MSLKEKFFEVIENAKRDDKRGWQKKLSEKTGIDQGFLSRLSTGKATEVGLGTLDKMIDVLGIERFFTNIPSSYVHIPLVDAVAGAGLSNETDGNVRETHAFREDYLQAHGISKKAILMIVRGTSMEPLIKDGDMIMVDRADTEPKDGLIYCLAFDDNLVVKRLEKILDGWSLRSENPYYTDIKIQGDEVSNMKIFGRVRWFARLI